MEKIFSAKTFEEAKEQASTEFGANELDIHFEIIEQPVKKLLGGLKGEFRVRAIYEKEEAKTASPAMQNFSNSFSKPSAPINSEKSHKPAASTNFSNPVSTTKSEPLSAEELAQYSGVISYIENILKSLGASGYSINVKKTGDSNVFDITGDNLGIIIGRRGETLDALQYLAILANNRSSEEAKENRARIMVDCNGYREKRAETLESLAIRTSNKVIKQGRRVTLEPMNPYERRIIHSKVSEIDGVYSNSVGEEPYRKVVISAEIPKRRTSGERSFSGDRNGGGDRNFGGDKRFSNSRGGGNRDNRDSRDNRDRGRSSSSSGITGRTYKQSSGFSTSFEREYKREPSPEISQDTADVEKNTSLYGKIEL